MNRPRNRRRGIRPRLQGYAPEPTPDEWCEFCKQPPWEPDRFGERSCIPFLLNGMPRIPHAWNPDDLDDDIPLDTPCQCGTPVGGFHHWPCDIEPCPWADEASEHWHQLWCCGCLEDLELP